MIEDSSLFGSLPCSLLKLRAICSALPRLYAVALFSWELLLPHFRVLGSSCRVKRLRIFRMVVCSLMMLSVAFSVTKMKCIPSLLGVQSCWASWASALGERRVPLRLMFRSVSMNVPCLVLENSKSKSVSAGYSFASFL